jgi:hypothetical protein
MKATPNECAATDSTSRTPRSNQPMRGTALSRISSVSNSIIPSASDLLFAIIFSGLQRYLFRRGASTVI